MTLFATDPAGTHEAAGAIEVVLVLLIVATALAIVAHRFAIPYPALLVVGGLVLGFVPALPEVTLEPDIVFLLFLPPILFGAGYFTSIRDLKANRRPIAFLAVGLVLFTTVVVAVVAKAVVGESLPWAAAFALGAIVAPPDAVAATAIFQRLGVPRRMVTILEGESLLNDATALVAYRFAVVAAVSGSFSLVEASVSFVVVAIGGALIGWAVGHLVALFVRRVDDPVYSVVITFLAPVAAYLAAETFDLSGVLSTVVAGIWVGRHAPRQMSSAVRLAGVAAWQVLLFLINGAVFILIGLQLPGVLAALADRPTGQPIIVAAAVVVAAIVARIVWVFPTTYLPRWASAKLGANDPYPPVRNVAVVAWAGMRGVVSLAAALALPAGFPERDLVVFVTFVVILATLLGQGLTLPLVIRLLRIDDGEAGDGHDEAHARAITVEAAVARIEELAQEWPGHLELIETLRAQYGHRSHHAELHHDAQDEHGDADREAAEQELLEHRAIRVAVIAAEREALVALRERGGVSDEAFRRVERDLDLEELRMEV